MGWDSSVGIGVASKAGLEANVGVGNSYSFLIGKTSMPGPEVAWRIAAGVAKLGMDLATMNYQGMLRDGLGVIGGVADSIVPGLVDAVVDLIIPLPPGTPGG